LESFFTGDGRRASAAAYFILPHAWASKQQMAEELAAQAWFVRIRTSEATPAFIDFAVGKATLQEAIVAILHRPDLELGDEVTSTSQLTAREISSYRLRPDEVRTYGRRIYNAAAGRWIFERGMVD
jgi:hypothetical protein